MPIVYTVNARPQQSYPYSLIFVGICVVVFIFQALFPIITDLFVLRSQSALVTPWTFITSMFLHGGFAHLFFNMFALAIFGTILEKIIGSRRFLTVYFAAGIIAGIASLPFYSAVLGASGAIMGVLGCLAILRPRMTVWMMYAPMPMIVAAGFWILLDLAGFFSGAGGIANAAHLGGIFFGIGYGLWTRKNFGERRKIIRPVSDRDLDDWEVKYM